MKKYLLDTNVLVQHFRGAFDLSLAVSKVGVGNCFVSAITEYELLHGAIRSGREQESERVELTLGILQRADFDGECASHSAKIRHELELGGLRIGPHDLLLAGTARAKGFVLVTHNTGEFQRVQGIEIVDWQDRPTA